MAQAVQSVSGVTARRSRGFTLVEMMIVVAIVGILATLAVVGYRKLINASHVTEATGMVQNIRVAQEAYHAETQRYANVSKSLTDYYPSAPVYQQVTAWGAQCNNCTDQASWASLPVHVDGPVRFGYATVAGLASEAPPGPVTVNGSPLTFPALPTSDWFVIAADGDLDGNAAEPNNTHVYASSWDNQIWVDRDGQ
jgi:type IV pilus assembly protein PilA